MLAAYWRRLGIASGRFDNALGDREAPVMTPFEKLVEIVRKLRGPDGCPWDREQTAASLRPCLLEEAYEVLDAITAGDPDAMRDELGDLLLQVVMHAAIAAEAGTFAIDDVIEALIAKMTRRHPHVFAGAVVADSAEVLRHWSRIKAEERAGKAAADTSVLSGLPPDLPALHAASRMGEKAGRVGFDWTGPRAALAKVREELAELEQALATGAPAAIEHELGDALFALASVARLAEQSPELALRAALGRFGRRFRHIERVLRERGQDIHATTPAELEALWDVAKEAENA
jgi:tetrapyrrole methylase family protein/MazG family protein